MATFEKLGGLEDVILIRPARIEDERGFFAETFRRSEFLANGIDCAFVQENHSLSRRKRTVRGLHFQTPPHAQAKLVRCTAGRILDVAVDIRPLGCTIQKQVDLQTTLGERQDVFPEVVNGAGPISGAAVDNP